jgi:hypothetical protein
MRLRFRAPQLLRGARVRLSTGRRVTIPRSGLLTLTGRRCGRATVFSLGTVRQLRDLGFRREGSLG